MNWKNKMQRTGFIMLLTICWSAFSFAQVNQVDSQGRKNGTWAKYYPNTQVLRYKGQFIHGKPVGKFVYYFEDAKVKAIILHDTNSNHAKAYMYFANGALAASGNYIGQKKDSIWTEFSPNGDVTSRSTYKNGKLDGLKTMYYGTDVSPRPNEVLILKKIHFKNGQADGPFISYFDDGTVKSKGQFKNGELEGVVKKFHPNGQLMLLERFRGGQRNGWWITYDKTGKEQGRRYYKMGKPLEGKELKKYMEELKAKGIDPNK